MKPAEKSRTPDSSGNVEIIAEEKEMPTGEMPTTPNDTLAEIIASALSEAGLAPDKLKTAIEEKFKSGGASEDDWSGWIDAATTPSEEDGGDSDDEANH